LSPCAPQLITLFRGGGFAHNGKVTRCPFDFVRIVCACKGLGCLYEVRGGRLEIAAKADKNSQRVTGGRRVAQGDLFRSEPEPPVWARVDTSRARVERLRRFGAVSDPVHKSKKRVKMTISQREENREWAELSDGCYLLGTNLTGQDAATLWKTYIGLTQIEDSFRINKHDLGLRPIYHHRQARAQAHILVCFLAVAMWRTLQQWMNGCAPSAARKPTSRSGSKNPHSPCRQLREMG